ncbi:hypothetical protein TARUN_10015 [Trichoderma arundinaceum]|uniref:Uncharacterized protein n=1 Tax=Trichoderma arundinaceum TaxID=490622 RepID=A0A395N7Z2_TRIAR|nr:hypothetical protein TARUN_10015 [Trichoderma arundinaceum]
MVLYKTDFKEDSCQEERDDSGEGRRIVSVDDIRGDSEVIYVGEKVEREDKTKDNKAPPPEGEYGASADDVIGMGQGGVID